MPKGDDRYLFYKELFRKKINAETIGDLVLKFGNDQELGEEVRKLYLEVKDNP